MVVVVGDVSCSVLLLAVVCCDGPLRGGLAGGRVEDSKLRRPLSLPSHNTLHDRNTRDTTRTSHELAFTSTPKHACF